MSFTVKTDKGYGSTYVATYNSYGDALRHALTVSGIATPGERVSVVQRINALRENTITVVR
jgi:hypothetical protein